MKQQLSKFDQTLFEPAPSTRLALLRIVIGVYTLFYLSQRYRMIQKVARTEESLFQPVGVAKLHKRPVSPQVFRRLLIATIIANMLFIVGWRHRATGPAFASLLLWLLSYRNSWSMIYHSDNALVLHVLVLGVTPAADAWSLDAQRAPATPTVDWRYGWPIRLMNILTALTYFVSAVAKIKGPLGLRWAGGTALRDQVAMDGLRKDLLGGRASLIIRRLYNYKALFSMIGIGSLIVELAGPFALLHKRTAQAWALVAWLMHWGILIVMGIQFRYQLAGLIFAPFFELERGVAWLTRRWR